GTGDWHQPDDTFQMPAANVTLYAQWERDAEPPPTFTVTYDGNGNTAGVPPVDAEEYPVGAEVTVLGRNNLVKDGYHFLGWNTAPDGTGDWHQPDDTLQMPAANVTLYAQWERNAEPPPTFRVFYNGNGHTAGTAPIDAVAYLPGTSVVVLGPNNLVKDGYRFIGWNTSPNGTGTWRQPGERFQMPAANVTLYAQWEPEEEALQRQAYMIGRPDGLIHPRDNITRAEIATIFFRLITDEMREEYWTQTHPFSDVRLGNWFNNAVATTTNMGLFRGVREGYFAPHQAITRGELAAVMARFFPAAELGPFAAGEDMFRDIADHWAREYINFAAENGWVEGPEGIGGPFNPSIPITRAETAAMVNRIFKRLLECPQGLHPDMLTWPDNSNEESWYFLHKKAATNSYTYEWLECGVYKTWTSTIEPRDWSVLERPNSRPEDIHG
ncbi:MAG: InlB B-repeat-containing protein, partial [Oscillospiraceae bacterium]|nr:InlB B-repeat-containing protein [Oscillospiraceae bacterium]